MYNDRRYGRYVYANRWKAIFFTLLFHAAIIGAIAFQSQLNFKQYLPDKVKDVLGMEEPAQDDVVRP